MKNYRFGISWRGLLAVALVMLPNILYLFFTPVHDLLGSNEASFWLWNILENIGRVGTMASLVLLRVRGDGENRNPLLLGVGIGSLISYYILWVLYFFGVANDVLLLGLAVFPVVFFLTTSLRLRNLPAFLFSILFGVCHIWITAGNFLLLT